MKIVTKYSFLLLTLFCVGSVSAKELVTGEVVGRNIFGLATDVNGDPLLIKDVPLIYESANFEQIVSLEESPFKITGFGDVLGGLYLTRMDSGSDAPVDTMSFNLAGVDGLSSPQGGILTSWNSILFGETQLVDAANPQSFADEFGAFYKGNRDLIKPYKYGWVSEAIVLDVKGNAKVIKNYSAGRVFASQLFMMPDAKSLYMFDKENSGNLYLFVSEEANSLAKGALYAVTFDGARLGYELLGHSSALKVKFKLKKAEFDGLFSSKPAEVGGCPSSFVYINTIYGEECLKVKKRNKKYVGLFDPIRTLAMKKQGTSLTKFTNVSFWQDKGQVELTHRGGQRLVFGLGQSADIDSQYIIQESQR